MTRDNFRAALGFPLDDFQRRALDALDGGNSVLVAAPTGSGKTVVAEYAVAVALASGAKAFYTTPIKALSNQKFHDLRAVHGPSRVGLLTGDNAVNGNAPVVVMTTEVLRNMIYAGSPALERLAVVVLDEVHYLQDPYRGAVWEEVIVHLDPEVRLVCLSATVSNAEEFGDWLSTVRGGTEVVIEERRPVELRHLYGVALRGVEEVLLMPTFVEEHGRVVPNPRAAEFDPTGFARGRRPERGVSRGSRAGRQRPVAPRRADVVEELARRDMLPAIYFIFSRAACDDAADGLLAARVRLNEEGSAPAVAEIAERHCEGLSDDDLEALGYGPWLAALEAGVAAHHAGMVPPMKEAVEEAFQAGLVKVVFATETLALGINMPARSVVIERLTKFTGERHEFLTSGEYTQLTGRAGRRGIDEIGYGVVLWNRFARFDQVASLATRRTYELTSSFRPTYNMAVNLVRRYQPEEAHHLLNLSFAQYRVDREVVALERQADHVFRRLEKARAAVARSPADTAAAQRVKRLERNLERARRRPEARSETLSRRLDQVLEVLAQQGYVDGWSLTPAGEMLSRIYSESDLLVAEAVRAGLLDAPTPAEVAALASLFTYEARGREAPTAPRWPTPEVARRAHRVEDLWRTLAGVETGAGLPETRPPDGGFAAVAHAWASGRDLDDVLGDEELTGGDFVRNVRQLIDLLRRLAEAADAPGTRRAARAAAEALFRGIIEASSRIDT